MRRLHAPSGRVPFQAPRPVAGGGPGLDSPPDAENTAPEGAGGVGAEPNLPPPAPACLAPTAAPPPPPLPKRAKFAAPSATAAAAAAHAPATTSAPAGTAAEAAPTAPAAYYLVLYCKRSGKKRINKSFADGVLEVRGEAALCLMDDEGKVVGRTRLKGCGGGLPPGATGEVGQWEFEVVEAAPAAAFASGELFIGRGGCGGGGGGAPALALARPGAGAGGPPSRAPLRHAGLGGRAGLTTTATAPTTTTTPAIPPPLFDLTAPDALVLAPAVPGVSSAVVADPFLVRRMRPHQREGLAFLYAAVTGARTPGQAGCVLAHEMGLGKTLTSLALMWTLLRQGGPGGRPLGRRTVVACPSSLVDNWAAEARKWLGDERFKAIALRPGADAPSAVAGFLHGGVHPCLIASYEALRKVGPSLAGRVDLLVCDEGHRLKAAGGNQTIASLKAIGCRRVVLLTGTPLQNDLSELFAVLVSVCGARRERGGKGAAGRGPRFFSSLVRSFFLLLPFPPGFRRARLPGHARRLHPRLCRPHRPGPGPGRQARRPGAGRPPGGGAGRPGGGRHPARPARGGRQRGQPAAVRRL